MVESELLLEPDKSIDSKLQVSFKKDQKGYESVISTRFLRPFVAGSTLRHRPTPSLDLNNELPSIMQKPEKFFHKKSASSIPREVNTLRGSNRRLLDLKSKKVLLTSRNEKVKLEA